MLRGLHFFLGVHRIIIPNRKPSTVHGVFALCNIERRCVKECCLTWICCPGSHKKIRNSVQKTIYPYAENTNHPQQNHAKQVGLSVAWYWMCAKSWFSALDWTTNRFIWSHSRWSDGQTDKWPDILPDISADVCSEFRQIVYWYLAWHIF